MSDTPQNPAPGKADLAVLHLWFISLLIKLLIGRKKLCFIIVPICANPVTFKDLPCN